MHTWNKLVDKLIHAFIMIKTRTFNKNLILIEDKLKSRVLPVRSAIQIKLEECKPNLNTNLLLNLKNTNY